MKAYVPLLCLLILPASVVAQKAPREGVTQPGTAPCSLTEVSYDWDFSNNDQGFTSQDCDQGGLPVWEYGLTNYIPGAPGAVWGTKLDTNYPDEAGMGLASPAFLVTPQSSRVEVYHYFDIETDYDGCNVSVGLWPNGTIVEPIGGYTVSQISSSPSYYARCVDNETGWTGHDATWRVDCFDLSAFLYSTVQLEFDFGADESINYPGWYLSRVRVGGVSPPLGVCCNLQTGGCSIATEPSCLEAGGEWHPDWNSCDPNPCPQPIVDGSLTLGKWFDAEPWHDWVSSLPGTVIPVEVNPGEITGEIDHVEFFSSIDNGASWQFVGADYDGSEPHLNTYDQTVLPMGDGWSTGFHVPDLPPATLIKLKALAFTPSGTRVVTGQTHSDPAPPSLGTTNLQDWIVTDRDNMGVEIYPNGTDVEKIVIFRGRKENAFVKGIPGIDQHIWSNDHCAPTAAAQCLKYFESHGDYVVTAGLDNYGLVGAIASKMRTRPGVGTYVSNWIGGMGRWIHEHGAGYTIRNTKHYTTQGSLTWTIEDWLPIRNELERCQDVLLGVFWSTGGAHALTLDAITNQSLPNGRIRLGFKDPWTGSSSAGELNPYTGWLYNVTGAGNGGMAYIGASMIVCPEEGAVDGGGPGEPIFNGLPPGPPYVINVQIPDLGAWFFHIVIVNTLGNSYRIGRVVVRTAPGGMEDSEGPVPFAFFLEPAAPNPFLGRTEITYFVRVPTRVNLAVHDVSGRPVITLLDGEVTAGQHKLAWNGMDAAGTRVPSGVYYVRMEVSGRTWTRSLTLLR